MSETTNNNYDICGHVIQNAKDIQALKTQVDFNEVIREGYQRINDNKFDEHRKAGLCTAISTIILGGCFLIMISCIDTLQKRVKKLEDDRSINAEG